ncbi:MAG: 16S rRNA (guanine(527)-N(7))-methyltransferase RsmG [Rhizobiaceae bacterium]
MARIALFSEFNVSRETLDRLKIYRDLLICWQKRINLVGPSTLADIENRHFADCLQIAPLLHDSETVADLGSGAGFPGIIIAMLLAERNTGSVHLIESVGKKCAFLREVIRETGLRETVVAITVHHGRIEDELPAIGDVSLITARALAPLAQLFQLTEGRITGETRALFQKGQRFSEEVAQAHSGWSFTEAIHPSKVDSGSVIIELHNVVRT